MHCARIIKKINFWYQKGGVSVNEDVSRNSDVAWLGLLHTLQTVDLCVAERWLVGEKWGDRKSRPFFIFFTTKFHLFYCNYFLTGLGEF
jgi:hypothetical protein